MATRKRFQIARGPTWAGTARTVLPATFTLCSGSIGRTLTEQELLIARIFFRFTPTATWELQWKLAITISAAGRVSGTVYGEQMYRGWIFGFHRRSWRTTRVLCW